MSVLHRLYVCTFVWLVHAALQMKTCKTLLSLSLTSSLKVENKRNNTNFHHFIFDYVSLLVLLSVALHCCCCYCFEFSSAFCVLMRWEKIHSRTQTQTHKASSRRSNWICYESYSVTTFIRASNENYFFVPPQTLEMNRACVECVEMWRWRAYEKKHHKSYTLNTRSVFTIYSNRLWQQQQKSGHIVCKCIAFRSQFICLPEHSLWVCMLVSVRERTSDRVLNGCVS